MGRKLAAFTLILLIGILSVGFRVQEVKAGDTIYIRADGSVDPSTWPIITFDKVTYTFTSNIVEQYGVSIVVQRSGITIDGKGLMLWSTYEGNDCFYLFNVSGVTLSNVNIYGYQCGVHAYASPGLFIMGNNIGSGVGINAQESPGLVISENNFTLSSVAIESDSSSNTVIGNNITNCTTAMQFYDNSSNNTISRNNIQASPGWSTVGIMLMSSNNNTIFGNNISEPTKFSDLQIEGLSNNITGNEITGSEGHGVELGGSSNTLSGNNITDNYNVGLVLIGSSNVISGNNISGNVFYGIGIDSSYSSNSSSNVFFENDVVGNGCGVLLSAHALNNVFYHDNFIGNKVQVSASGSANVWDDGYPNGGNYWSDYNGTDSNGDGIGDTPYMIDANNKDRYPLMLPVDQTKQTELQALFDVYSSSYLGNVRVETSYSSPNGNFAYPIISVPANKSVNLLCIGWLDDYKNEPLNGKEIKLTVDSNPVSSYLTTNQAYNLNWTIALNLPAGLHNGDLMFEGDENHSTSSFEFTILAYKSSQFNITKDAFSFPNYGFSFDEFGQLVTKLLQENVVDQTLDIPLLVLYPIVSAGGHCFGMAAASSAYYLDPSLEPKPVNTYALSNSDSSWDVDWYQLSQLWVGNETSIGSSLSSVESLMDSGTPVVLGIKEAQHAITLIGYYQGSHETFLVAYDNNMPNSTVVYGVKDGKLMYGSTNVTSAVFVDPYALPLPYHPTEFLKEIFTKYLGLQIHSPVDINITSTSGKELLIENNMVVRNDFGDSYVYLGESKIILLPSSENYTVEATGTANGQVSLDCVFTSGDQIVIHQSQNVTISNSSKLYLFSLQSTALYVDSNGDGIIDQTITIPEFSSSVVLLLFVISIPLIIAIRKRQVPSKSRNDVS